MKAAERNVLIKAQAIARLQSPSIAFLLRKYGYGFEADLVELLVKAVEEAKTPPPVSKTNEKRDPSSN